MADGKKTIKRKTVAAAKSKPAPAAKKTATKKAKPSISVKPADNNMTPAQRAAVQKRAEKQRFAIKEADMNQLYRDCLAKLFTENKEKIEKKLNIILSDITIETLPDVFTEILRKAEAEAKLAMFLVNKKRFYHGKTGENVKINKIAMTGTIRESPREPGKMFLVFPKNRVVSTLSFKEDKDIPSVSGHVDPDNENIFVGDDGNLYNIAKVTSYDFTNTEVCKVEDFIIGEGEEVDAPAPADDEAEVETEAVEEEEAEIEEVEETEEADADETEYEGDEEEGDDFDEDDLDDFDFEEDE